MIINTLKRSKIAFVIYNLFKKSELKHNAVSYKKYGVNKKYYSSVSSEDFKHLESPKNIYDEKDSKVELPKNPKFSKLKTSTQESIENWSEQGYAVLKNVISSETVDTVNSDIDKLIADKTADWRTGDRVMFAIHKSKTIRDIALSNEVMGVLEMLMGKEVGLFQSINFLKGTQQRTHSDSIHMSTFPYGNIIAVWIALEDITEENGPLHYYPGSHKLPYIVNADYGNVGSKLMLGSKSYGDYENRIQKEVDNNDFEKKRFLAKKGDAFIWHANLLHGGEPVLNKQSSRKSMVFHYYAKDCVCFHEITQRPTLKKQL
jgi:ectoine hydroxylase-related dioxygenase (phytanoyl-CoA dioxygenase family)